MRARLSMRRSPEGIERDPVTPVMLADCGTSPPAALLAALASTLDSGEVRRSASAGPVFVFAKDDTGSHRWAVASHLPAAKPQSNKSGDPPVTLTRPPLG